MCRSCKVIADVHQRPRLGLESLTSSSSSALPPPWGDADNAHSAVDEVLESWSEAACGKAFLALTDLINFENDIHSKENQKRVSITAADVEDTIIPSLSSAPPSVEDPLSILLPFEAKGDLSKKGGLQQHCDDITTVTPISAAPTPSSTASSSPPSNNDVALATMFDHSSLAYVIQSLIDNEDHRSSSNDSQTLTLTHDHTHHHHCPLPSSSATTTAMLHPYHQLTPSSTPCLSSRNSCDHHYHLHSYHDGNSPTANTNCQTTDESTTEEEQLNRFLNGLLQYSTTTTTATAANNQNAIASAAFSNAFATGHDFSVGNSFGYSEECSPTHFPNPTNFSTVTMHSSSAIDSPTSPCNCCPQPAQQPLPCLPRTLQYPTQKIKSFINSSIPATGINHDSFDFSIFKKHPLLDYMKEFDAKRHALIENARQSTYNGNSSTTIEEDKAIVRTPCTVSENKSSSFTADAPPLKYYQYFWRAAIEGSLDKASTAKSLSHSQRRRVLLLNMANVARCDGSQRSVVIENGKLLVRLPTTTSKDFIGWTSTPALLDPSSITKPKELIAKATTTEDNQHQCAMTGMASLTADLVTPGPPPQPQQQNGRRKRAISEDMLAISKMTRREVLNEILAKCGSCNMKELDIILSSFVASHSQSLTTPQLRQLLHVIGAVPKHHLFSWISGQAELPTRRLAPLSFFEKKMKNSSSVSSSSTPVDRSQNQVSPSTTTSTTSLLVPTRLLTTPERRPLRGASYHYHTMETANEWRENFVAGQLLLAYVNCNHPLLRRFRTTAPASRPHDFLSLPSMEHRHAQLKQNSRNNDKRVLSSIDWLANCSSKGTYSPYSPDSSSSQ